MTGAELLEVFRQVTAQPWTADLAPNGDVHVYSDKHAVAIVRHERDAAAIAALANHAVPLAELVQACELCAANVPPLVIAALARVHATGASPTNQPRTR